MSNINELLRRIERIEKCLWGDLELSKPTYELRSETTSSLGEVFHVKLGINDGTTQTQTIQTKS